MKIRWLILEGKVPGWVAEARSEYVQKISGFVPTELKSLKTPSAERDQAEIKRRREGVYLLDEIEERDLVVLFDEKGKAAKTSEEFAVQLGRVLESGKNRVVFVIGGAYGFSDDVYKRADMKWSLSSLTFNHWLAQLAALEQVYRGLTILKNIPYHNR
jgi:23S rRNA (pseudouridine1915-N3)-methyltransferase